MSTLPSVEDVQKYTTDGVINFLRNESQNFNDNDFNILRRERVSGRAFLRMTKEDLINPPYNFPGGPALEIVEIVESLNSQKERSTKRQKKGDPSFEDILEVVASLKRETNISGSSTDAQESDLQDIIRSKNGVLAVIGESALYVRRAYKDLYRFVTDPDPDPKFLITGTSGVGKTCYRFKGSNLETGEIDDFSDYLYSPETWYLVDSKRPSIDPNSSNSARTVVAVSPNSLNNDKFQDFAKDVVNKYYMPPWTIEELKACQKHIFKQVPEDLMLEIFDRAGGVPRYVLRQPARVIKKHRNTEKPEVWDTIVNKSMERIEEAILEVKNFDDLILCFTENASFVKISNRIIHRWPVPSYEEYYFEWASNYIYESVMRKLEKFRWDELLQKIRNPTDVTNSRGIMFELYAIHHFETLKDENFGYDMRCLEVNDDHNIAVRPRVKNFGAVDLFVMPNVMFQFTVSQKHPIKQKELVKIIPNMLAYRRDNGAKILLVFVVPDDIYDSFKLQRYVTPKKNNDDDLDDFKDVERLSPILNNVEQWVLKIDLSMQRQEES
ncbi:hypothetical protein C1645_837982 [Glomus cerebriforme]|uniref:Crinkler family protein n=1 Tax=Glomus cerebriforme TaxID=658196 RepID=A0A397S4A0_9GLOM|nr:hypothetical protein C1645_837982 [Glomus cerebriforme]